ncbi:hypothetical protein AM228_17620 [Planktothricoides sp. SR001]|uniref:DISARM system helicase DrmA n=1 Tax=Planktothricoides sp. SR001 TaxID=1705388 RepID=UPI0006C25FB6|nr:DISARM system helicase DrmA [Planktothricoides sp. SR001]KOR35614.1 hypothetical protein AM228_17620 [Planktothricoides sp. SR001]
MSSITSAQVRDILVHALEFDLIGPTPDDIEHAREIINSPPTKWYLTGFLCPKGAPLKDRIDDDRGQDDLNSSLNKSDRGEDSYSPEKKAARTAPFPSSVGLTFLLKNTIEELEVTVTWGDYEAIELTPENMDSREGGNDNICEAIELTPENMDSRLRGNDNICEAIELTPENMDSREGGNDNICEAIELTPENMDSREGGNDNICEAIELTPENMDSRLRGNDNSLSEKPGFSDPEYWQRIPHKYELTLKLRTTEKTIYMPIPDSNGLELAINNRPLHIQGNIQDNHRRLFADTNILSVFLVNKRKIAEGKQRDTSYIFQAQLQLECREGFLPRPDLREGGDDDWDERVAAVQYRHNYEFAVGHNASAFAQIDPENSAYCPLIKTTWVPAAEVAQVAPAKLDQVELNMEKIGQFSQSESLQESLRPLTIAYRQWIAEQQKISVDSEKQVETSKKLLSRAQIACDRINQGIDLLTDSQVFYAFKLANQAVAQARRQQLAQEIKQPADAFSAPNWRPFQLAFILLNLGGIVNSNKMDSRRRGNDNQTLSLAGEEGGDKIGDKSDRDIVDLLFFPTGGGKTEAYLGLAAFTLVYRRLTNQDIYGAGVSVIMRYTLRLLTLDQLERATRLICALELIRKNHPDNLKKLGQWPFEIGLWVGQSATPNRMGKKGDKNPDSARQITLNFKKDSKRSRSPIPLEKCPWCGEKFTPDSFWLHPDESHPTQLLVKCQNFDCEFSEENNHLPIIAIDESIYRRLPCFLISTVDKFAGLPWFGQTAALFGKVSHYQTGEGFYSTADNIKGRGIKGTQLKQPLPPPDLIIQDELHLISGPLGTMVGLYETAIDELCSRIISTPAGDAPLAPLEKGGDRIIRPKIVASTATVRRADRQIQALFNRTEIQVFPPPGPNLDDSFFAQTIPTKKSPGRLYIGVAAQGRSLKVVLLRTYLALLSAAQKQWELAGGQKNSNNPVDPYMTLLGYFNSLRELGGSRRIVEDEVVSRLQNYQSRQRYGEKDGLFANRKIQDDQQELTSRVTTDKIANTKRRLSISFAEKDPKKERVDIALATNMISVGLDIVRLGLMVILGQPKTAAEYIQSSSRVGRDPSRPGLVVTLLNIHRPRDRSHYERFMHWHNNFYRSVEVTSVTPFSVRALDRGLAAVTVALTRLNLAEMTPPMGAGKIAQLRSTIEQAIAPICDRAASHTPMSPAESAKIRQEIEKRVMNLLDTWTELWESNDKILQYNQTEAENIGPLLCDPNDPKTANLSEAAKKFKTPRSLRDVEPTVNLWISRD